MYDLDEIKARTDLVSTAQSLGLNIRKSGDRCVSPLRAGATNPTSFCVRDDRWFDFGSGQWGDVIDLVAEVKYNGDKGKAIKELARNAGLDATDADGWWDYTNTLNNQIAFYQQKLTQEDFDYLHGRGLRDETIAALRIGRNHEGRLVIPYIKNGYAAYYCTRAMPGCRFPESKYRKMHTDTHNVNIVWGWDSILRGGDTLVIAEGVFDAISFWQEGYPVLSAVTGFFSGKQIADVISAARQFKRVFFVYDNDKVSHAGDKFAEKMARILLKERIPFVVGHVPDEYKDVSEYYEAGEILQHLVNDAIPGLTFLCEKYTDINELAKFLRPIALYNSVEAAENAINDLQSRGGKFTAAEWSRLYKRVTSPPSEKEVKDKVIRTHELLYVEEVGFYEWNGLVWERIADNTVNAYCTAALGNFVSANRARNSAALIKYELSRSDIAFDQAPVLTFKNGTLELETGVFRKPDMTDYCSIVMDYDYDPNAKCPTWESFVSDVTNGDGIREENLQFIPGYALMPHCKYQKIFVLLGKGGNGKSVYLEIIQRLFGKRNITNVEPTGLAQEFQRVLIKDSLMNVSSDINSDLSKGEIREWMLKISDGASVQACYKGKTHITFEPRCKLVFACNTVPTAEVVNGLERRFLFIDFPCKYVDDPDKNDPLQRKRDINIVDKLLDELPGIFNWAYAGYKLLNKVGYFTETLEHADILSQFKTVSNPVEEFCDDRTFAGQMTRDEIYSWYRDWCENAGHKPLSRTRFVPKFREKMERQIVSEQYVRRGGKRERVFIFKSTGGNDDE